MYGHPKAPHPHVRRVPWYETTAEDGGTHDPEEWRTAAGDGAFGAEDGESDVEETLSGLGNL